MITPCEACIHNQVCKDYNYIAESARNHVGGIGKVAEYDITVKCDMVSPTCQWCKFCDAGTDEEGERFFKCLGPHYGGTNLHGYCHHGEPVGILS